MKTITVAGVDIDIHDGPIGITCSGGTDSSLLLYILMKYATGEIHVTTCSAVSSEHANSINTQAVINKCIELTGNLNVFHHVYFVETPFRNLFKLTREFLYYKNIKVCYTGVTKCPSKEVTESFKDSTPVESERSSDIIRDCYINEGTIYTPFANIDKQKISEMYNELGIRDELFPLTRSCEHKTIFTGHCGQCWWCEERKWGFGALE
jgi:7-cyano-7-deazaguanine synthase in queuosine biosynthesis